MAGQTFDGMRNRQEFYPNRKSAVPFTKTSVYFTLMKGCFLYFLFSLSLSSFAMLPPVELSIHPSETFNVSYGTHPLQTFKLITPENSDEETKVAILIHGGGWVIGYHPGSNVTTFNGRYGWDLEEALLDSGIAVLTMKYRTACYSTQQATFSNNTRFNIDRMMEDIDLVIDKLITQAETYRVSPNYIHLIGESAGGHIAMYYGFSENARPQVRSVVSMFAPTNLDAQEAKQFVHSLPDFPMLAPDYFLHKNSGCNSVTNQPVGLWNSLKSFSDHYSIQVNQANPFLDTLSTTFEPNIQNEIPLFLTHGKGDQLVPFSQAIEMVGAVKDEFSLSQCPDLDFSCRLKIKLYDNCNHGWNHIGGTCNRDAIMMDVVNWVMSQ